MGSDNLSRAEAQFRVQRVHDFLVARLEQSARTYLALVALDASSRPRRTRPANHSQPAPACDKGGPAITVTAQASGSSVYPSALCIELHCEAPMLFDLL